MNLYFAWKKTPVETLRANLFFWSDFYRPLGSLFYRGMFAAAGFNPLPFRLVCLAIGAANIALCGWFVKLISGSERAVALAVLLFAFQPRLLELWYRTSTIYDLLCFGSLYLAACLYIAGRKQVGVPGRGRLAAVFVCYVCALNSKEAAVSLPVILLAWEVLFGSGTWRRFLPAAGLALMNLPYLYTKTHGSSLLAGNPEYSTKYTWAQFEGSWSVYLQYIFVRDGISPHAAIAILVALLSLAMLVRSRVLVFAWVILFCGTLPVSFIPYRGGYALYVAWMGWVLYGAVVLVAAQDALLRRWPGYRVELACVVFALVAWRDGKINLHEQRNDPRRWLYEPPALVKSMVVQMRGLEPVLPRGARLLFVEDAFTTEEWTPYFIMKLAWHDDTLVIDRNKMMRTPATDWRDYQYVFSYDRGAYRQLKP